jgi:MFS family permease
MSGTWMQTVAQSWFVLELTKSPVAVGLLAVFQFGPFAILGLFGGAVADRLDLRRVLVGTQTAFMLTACALTTLTLTGRATVWELYLISAVTGTVSVLDNPVRQAFTVQMVGRDELPNAVALNSSLFNASRVVGPAVAGGLIALTGVGICFLVNALSFLVVISALLLMRVDELYPISRDQIKQTVFRGASEGLAVAWNTASIRVVVLMMLVIATIGINFNVLLPVLASRTLGAGPGVFGILSALFGAGALVGALVSASLGRASRSVLLYGAAFFALAELVLAPQRSVWAAGLVLVFTGIGFSLYASQSNTALQVVVADRLRARVLGIYGYVFTGTVPLGGLLAGWLAAEGGTQLAFLVAGLGGLAAVIYGATSMPRF